MLRMIWTGAAAVLLLLPFTLAGSAPIAQDRDAASLLTEIQSKRDEADPVLFKELAALRSKDAADALLSAYDSMASIYMRREVLRALATLDGVDDAQQTALQKLMDVATGTKERELRESAIDLLGECPNLGKTFLASIVESTAQDDIRERAMELHIQLSNDADKEWYRKLFVIESNDKKDKKKKKKKKKGDDDEEDKELIQYRLASVRAMAFEALAPSLNDVEVHEAAKDDWAQIRRLALLEMERRGDKQLDNYIEEVFTSNIDAAENRILAAQIIARMEGAKAAADFFDIGEKAATPTSVRFALADLLAELNDEAVNKKIAKKVGKGRGMEKIFYLRAARNIDDPKVSKAMQKLLADKDTEIQAIAAEMLGKRKDEAAIPALEKALKKPKNEEVARAFVSALSELYGADAEWDARLVEYAQGEDVYLRNAALRRFGESGKHTDLLQAALGHPQWSTRLTALEALASMRTVESVGWMIAQMQSEEGRILHEFADVLFELTGQPFRTSKGSWRGWWEGEGKTSELISASELRKRRKEEEDRRLKQVTSVEFFGIRIISERVAFVIDVSGSMTEMLRARYVDEKGETRMAVAQRELQRCIDGLATKALFNVIAFNSGVDRWLEDGIAGSTPENRGEAKEWVARLGAGGGTNIYDSMREAFNDPEVDTIYLLSDGEPSAGAHTDPGIIREHVRNWNEDRGVVIHCIAVGGSLSILEWLAEDSGGTYIKFN
jgi:HEAT repeat protein